MGYTHYFPGLTATPAVLADARKIIDASPVTICGPLGQGLPILDEADGILLNGFEAANEDYETFHLRGAAEPEYPEMSAFCKTAERPYDVVVMAILISAAVHSLEDSQGQVRSDGQWSNWGAGVDLFEQAVRPLNFLLDRVGFYLACSAMYAAVAWSMPSRNSSWRSGSPVV